MPPQDTYRLATRADLDLAVQWAADEGWNPGLHDADIFWDTDPEGFVCIEREGEVIGTGSIISYGAFGFMGFFIVKQGLRGQGIGAPFWHWRKERLQARLTSESGPTAIGMDGVFAMQPFYAKGGFQFAHRNLRMEGIGQSATPSPDLALLTEVPFSAVSAYDQRMFGYPRETFLRRWITPTQGLALGAMGDNGALRGYGVIRPCQRGHKIGPLFADDPDTAENLFTALSTHAPGAPIFLDIPEISQPAQALARRHQMTEQFGCARMYLGDPATIPWQTHIYGVTTFELG